MDELITMDSFGWNCPDNWQEIAEALNEIILSRLPGGIFDDFGELTGMGQDVMDEVWSEFCNETLDGVPKPIFEKGGL